FFFFFFVRLLPEGEEIVTRAFQLFSSLFISFNYFSKLQANEPLSQKTKLNQRQTGTVYTPFGSLSQIISRRIVNAR
ncbi:MULTISPECIES: hypothetical protein, partial [Gammaproteobacteria]|uniref:hypothetical protein n=1 Tax=Gammaproteobacteria TaxID=1236 RepID=UPI0040489746